MILTRPFDELEPPDQHRLDQRASTIFAAVSPAPQRPFFLPDRFVNDVSPNPARGAKIARVHSGDIGNSSFWSHGCHTPTTGWSREAIDVHSRVRMAAMR